MNFVIETRKKRGVSAENKSLPVTSADHGLSITGAGNRLITRRADDANQPGDRPVGGPRVTPANERASERAGDGASKRRAGPGRAGGWETGWGGSSLWP